MWVGGEGVKCDRLVEVAHDGSKPWRALDAHTGPHAGGHTCTDPDKSTTLYKDGQLVSIPYRIDTTYY